MTEEWAERAMERLQEGGENGGGEEIETEDEQQVSVGRGSRDERVIKRLSSIFR